MENNLKLHRKEGGIHAQRKWRLPVSLGFDDDGKRDDGSNDTCVEWMRDRSVEGQKRS